MTVPEVIENLRERERENVRIEIESGCPSKLGAAAEIHVGEIWYHRDIISILSQEKDL